MRRFDWIGLIACLLCLAVWVMLGFIVYHKGVIAGRREIVQQYAHQVQRLDKICDHKEIKSMLSEGRR